MILDIYNATQKATLDEHWLAARNTNIYIKILNNVTAPSSYTIAALLDKTDLKTFDYTETQCADGEFTVGNLAVSTLKFSFFTNSEVAINYPKSVGDDPQTVWGANWIELYFTPSDSSSLENVVRTNQVGFISSGIKSLHCYRVGEFFVTNSYFNDGIQTVECVNSVGRFIDNAYVPPTAAINNLFDGYLDALSQADLISADELPVCPNLSSSLLPSGWFEQFEGYTIREMLQGFSAVAGCNLGIENATYGGSSESISDYAKKVRLLYPGRVDYKTVYNLTYPTVNLGDYWDIQGQVYDYYSIPYSAIFKETYLDEIKFRGAVYGNHSYHPMTGGNYDLNIPQNPVCDAIGGSNIVNFVGEFYARFKYYPVRLKMNSCPAMQHLDLCSFGTKTGDIFPALITSINISGMSNQNTTSAGDVVAKNKWLEKSRNNSTAIKAHTNAISKLDASVAGFKEYIDLSDSSVGIFLDSRSITTTSTGYYQYTDYGRDNYRLLSVYETGVSNGYVVITASVSGQFVRVFQPSGSAAASSTVTLNAVFLKIT